MHRWYETLISASLRQASAFTVNAAPLESEIWSNRGHRDDASTISQVVVMTRSGIEACLPAQLVARAQQTVPLGRCKQFATDNLPAHKNVQ